MYTARLQENIGKVLHGRYTLVAAVGQGASGDVYLALDLSLGRKVAIKLLHSSLAGDPFFLKRFQSEAKSAASLNHPNIMRVFDWGESDSTPYLVLEYLSGGSLREFLNTGALLSESQAASLMLQVAQGLSYAHGRGYVHRDIKPANLLFDDEARIRIADFGLARALSEAAWTEPVGSLLGTVRYASPEQAMAKESDKSSDVYSLGLVIHEALLGYLPFTGDTTVALLMARVHDDIIVPDTLGQLKPVLEACLKVDSGERMSSSELVSQLFTLVRVLEPPAVLTVSGPSPKITDENGDLTEIGGLPLLSGVGSNGGTGLNSSRHLRNEDEATTQMNIGFASDPKNSKVNDSAALLSDTSVNKNDSGAVTDSRKSRKRPIWVATFIFLLAVVFTVLVLDGVPAKVVSFVLPSKVPLVVGDSLPAAQGAIKKAHLTIGSVAYAYSPTEAKGLVSSEVPRAGTSLSRGSKVGIVISKGPAPFGVPSVVGLPLSQAKSKLESLKLMPVVQLSYSETIPVDQVMSESPSSGLVDVGNKIVLTVSQGPAPRKVPVLVGEDQATATNQIRALALVPSVSQAFSNTVPSGIVISQTQSPGSMVQRGSTISFVVSKGPEIVSVPDVRGDSLQEAEAALNQAGLTVGSVYSYFGSNTVVATSPRPGARVPAGTSVSLITG